MTADLETPNRATTDQTETETETENEEQAQVIRNLAECPGCHSRVILFSRTIQTFCYRCGLPVTKLDELGLYYDVVSPEDQPEA